MAHPVLFAVKARLDMLRIFSNEWSCLVLCIYISGAMHLKVECVLELTKM